MSKTIIIGTRKSALALWQSEWVAARIREHGLEVELKKISTKGDKILDVALAKVGDKGLFVKELEEALLRGEIDMAVHSMKDMPTETPEGLTIGAICEREDSRDVLLSSQYNSLDELPQNAIVGTSSLRRIAQLLHYRGDLQIKDLRGNINTRLQKMEDGEYDAIILAAAGVLRLGWHDKIKQFLPPTVSLSAVGQGSVGIEVAAANEEIKPLLEQLNDRESMLCVLAERALLNYLEGGCQVPIGAYASLEDEKELTMQALIADLKGEKLYRAHGTTSQLTVEGVRELGVKLAQDLVAQGGDVILHDIGIEIGRTPTHGSSESD